jgi:indolepyruvate ferredoxin oxidoreductase beta subunit
MNTKTINILFCGTGGQGVLKAAEVCGLAAMYAGHHVKKSEVHGMAQRGGSVESHVRFGSSVFSPLIPEGAADILVSFYFDESARMRSYLRSGGKDLTTFLDKARASVPSPLFVNTYLLGVLSAQLAIDEEYWIKAIDTVFSGKRMEENIHVFRAGREAVL